MTKILHSKAARLLSVILALLMIFSVCSVGAAAESAVGTDVPAPSSTFYIYDEENILGVATKNAILTRNGQMYEKYGIQIAVMTLKEIPGADINAKGDYLHRVIDSWQLGGVTEKGLLLAVSVTQQDYVAVAGDGLSAEFPVQSWSELFDKNLEPKFSTGEYDAGILEVFTAMADKAELYAVNVGMTAADGTPEPSASPEPEVEEEEEKKPGFFVRFLKTVGMIIFIILVILIIGFIVIYTHGQMVLKKRREARRRAAMQARARQNEQRQNNDDVWNRY